MKRLVAMAILATAKAAFADAAVPDFKKGAGERGDGKPAWIGQCAERLERARDAAALLLPQLKQATVEATARERGVPGDPTAKQAFDMVQLNLWPLVQATLEPDPAAHSANLPWRGGGVEDGQRRARVDHGFQASYYVDLKPSVPRAEVGQILQRALDDCLRKAK
jgi:hypothetical protein